MRFRLQTAVIAITAIAICLAIATPFVRWMTLDEVQQAEFRLRYRKAQIIKIIDNQGADYASIDLSGMQVTEQDLRNVKALNPTSEIDLTGTMVDDEAILCLEGVRAAKIFLKGTKVTPEGVDALKRSLPHDVQLITDE